MSNGHVPGSLEDHEYRLRPVEAKVIEHGIILNDMREDTKATRNAVRSALITAAASIIVNIVLFFVLRAS